MPLQTNFLTNFLDRLPLDLKLLPYPTYLVGGTVRDCLLGMAKPKFDLDFVLPQNAVATARKIANIYQAGFVVLDEARQIARVVFDRGTLDFALQVGDNLVDDLQRRDFTINAIAYDCHQGCLIDPLGGIEDLERKIIKSIARANLIEDPLRLLRAYRQAAQLNFNIADRTRETIRSLAQLIASVSAERVQTELNYLLVNSQGDRWLQVAVEDGLLTPWLPQATANINELPKIELAKANIAANWHNLDLDSDSFSILVKLSALVSPQLDRAELELTNLKYSRAYIKSVVATVKHLPQLQARQTPMNLREQYEFFSEVKAVFPILIARSIALGVADAILQPLIARYLDPQDVVAYPQPLVTGNDLIEHLNLKPSPVIGKLLTEIQIAYIEGIIATFDDAIDWARTEFGEKETKKQGSDR
jgi:tRNA nucleotidyltransferase (CCA-adding enzyme)